MMNEENMCSCKNLKWYRFNQNNPGGTYDIDDKVDKNVFIQAHSHKEANGLAEEIGIYFNGVNNHMDCRCCGNRWSHVWKDDALDEISVTKETPNVKIYPYGSIIV